MAISEKIASDFNEQLVCLTMKPGSLLIGTLFFYSGDKKANIVTIEHGVRKPNFVELENIEQVLPLKDGLADEPMIDLETPSWKKKK